MMPLSMSAVEWDPETPETSEAVDRNDTEPQNKERSKANSDMQYYKALLESTMGTTSLKSYEYLFLDDDKTANLLVDEYDHKDENEDDFTNLVSNSSSFAPSSITMPSLLNGEAISMPPAQLKTSFPDTIVHASTKPAPSTYHEISMKRPTKRPATESTDMLLSVSIIPHELSESTDHPAADKNGATQDDSDDDSPTPKKSNARNTPAQPDESPTTKNGMNRILFGTSPETNSPASLSLQNGDGMLGPMEPTFLQKEVSAGSLSFSVSKESSAGEQHGEQDSSASLNNDKAEEEQHDDKDDASEAYSSTALTAAPWMSRLQEASRHNSRLEQELEDLFFVGRERRMYRKQQSQKETPIISTPTTITVSSAVDRRNEELAAQYERVKELIQTNTQLQKQVNQCQQKLGRKEEELNTLHKVHESAQQRWERQNDILGKHIVEGTKQEVSDTAARDMAKLIQARENSLELERERRMELQQRVVELERELVNERERKLNLHELSLSAINGFRSSDIQEIQADLKAAQTKILQADKSVQYWKNRCTELQFEHDDVESKLLKTMKRQEKELRDQKDECELLKQQVEAMRSLSTHRDQDPPQFDVLENSGPRPFDEEKHDVSPVKTKPSVDFAETIDISPIRLMADDQHFLIQHSSMIDDVNSEDYDEYGNYTKQDADYQHEIERNESLNMDIDELINDIREMTMERTQILDGLRDEPSDELHQEQQIDTGNVNEGEKEQSQSLTIFQGQTGDTLDHYFGEESYINNDRESILEQEEARLLQSQQLGDTSILDQTISLMENLTELVHCDKNDHSADSKETSVLEQLGVLADLLNEDDQQASLDRITNILKGPSILERTSASMIEQDEGRQLVSTTSTSLSPETIPQESLTFVSNAATHSNGAQGEGTHDYSYGGIHVWAELVEELREKVAFLKHDRAEVVRVTKDMIERERESYLLQLQVAVATAEREAGKELHDFKNQTQQVLQNVYGSLCHQCQQRLCTSVV